jgi:general stress protein 26
MITIENAQKLWDLVEPLKTGMLVTTHDHQLNGRPMHLVQGEFDGTFYFFTNIDSMKVDELTKNNDVCITFSCPKSQVYVSVSGNARINQDQTLIDSFWNPFVAAWFPQGKNDPSVALIEINTFQAESWNATSNTFVQLYQYAKATLTGEKPNMGNHEKLN